MDWVDLRSDTVTRPTRAMREAMLAAEVGDDVYGEDPTVNALQERVAGELGFEAALFVPSGTQSNLLALLSHCERGDEYLVGADAHTYKFEGGGAAVLGSIQPQPIPHAADGTLPLEALAAAVKPVDPHFARTRLLALENTWHGRMLPLDYLRAAHDFARERGLALHLDGARLYNAAVASGVSARAIARHFDSVSLCLSKGLGAPVGSVLAGSAPLIEKARRWRKVAGGGWRQAGILAAAGLYALDHHVERLAEDHARAARLAEGLGAIPGVALLGRHTNMVFVDVPAARLRELDAHLREARIRISIGYLPTLRLVTHLDVDDAGIERTIAAFRRFFGAPAANDASAAGSGR
jgi:threonine aldolase